MRSKTAAAGGIFLLCAASVLPLTSAGRSIAAHADLAFLETGRQKILSAALGSRSVAAAQPPAVARDGAAAKPGAASDLGLSALTPLVHNLQEPQIRLTGSRLGDWVASLAANPETEAKPAREPGEFRRIAQFGPVDSVDFAPTASASPAAAEPLPPLARVQAAASGRLKRVEDAAKPRRGGAFTKAELATEAFVPGKLLTGAVALRQAAQADTALLTGPNGRVRGPV